jgi:hypothetical protein
MQNPSHQAAPISASSNIRWLYSVATCFDKWRHGHPISNTRHITTADPTFWLQFSASVKCGLQDSIPGRELTRKRVGLRQLRDCDVTNHAQCKPKRNTGSGPPEDRSKQGIAFDIILNIVRLHINIWYNYKLYMWNNRTYCGNVEITAINEMYKVCQKAFCVWRPNHLTTDCYSWLNSN